MTTSPTIVQVARDFGRRLANRDKRQGDGKHTAIDFRRKFLAALDNPEIWKTVGKGPAIELDFEGVVKIGPSFANEAFAYFTQYASPERVLERIRFVNTSHVQMLIIEQELRSGYEQA
jgi:hypothetical protein